MGQAKQRGTREDRINQARDRVAEEARQKELRRIARQAEEDEDE